MTEPLNDYERKRFQKLTEADLHAFPGIFRGRRVTFVGKARKLGNGETELEPLAILLDKELFSECAPPERKKQ